MDITKEPMEIGPTCHYVMGGVEVDPDTAAASVPGLFAAGEVSGGMHGSNRLGGNSLSDLLVFGKRAGDGAADYLESLGDAKPAVVAGGRGRGDRPRRSRRSTRPDGESPYAVHAELQQTMNDLVGLIRREGRCRTRSPRWRSSRSGRASVRAWRAGLQPGLALRPGPAEHAARRRVRGDGRPRARGVARRAHPRGPPGDVARVAQGQPDPVAERRQGGDGAPADPGDARGPARRCSTSRSSRST